MKKNKRDFKAVVIGVSTGGVTALKQVLGAIQPDFPVPVLVVTHITPSADNGLAVLLDTLCQITVKEADDQESLVPGIVYIAPANYHLLVERGGRVALSVDPPVNFARPSVDVLFESAASVYGRSLIGLIMTGAGHDGSNGLLKVKECGGVAIVQDPADAEMDSMPRCALQLLKADYIIPMREIPALLSKLCKG